MGLFGKKSKSCCDIQIEEVQSDNSAENSLNTQVETKKDEELNTTVVIVK